MRAVLRFDGGCRPNNPGPAGFGIVVRFPDEEDVGKKKLSRFIGRKTNNEAEYFGLIVGIKYAYFLGARELDIISDSKLVVNQVSGNWKPKDQRMKVLCREAQDLLKKMFTDAWEISFQRRSQNTEADELCTAAIQWGRNRNPFTPSSIKAEREGNVVDPFKVGQALFGR